MATMIFFTQSKRLSFRASAFLGLFILGACQNKVTPPNPELTSPTPLNQTSATPSPEPSIAADAVKNSSTDREWLAEIKEIKPQVSFRMSQKAIWEDASVDKRLHRYDAVQTQENASARILYQSGSELKVASNSLIVFDQDPGQMKNLRPAKVKLNKKTSTPDRVLLRAGEVKGTTRSELWILSAGGLLKIDAKTQKDSRASATVAVKEGKTLKLTLTAGQGTLISTGKNIPLTLNTPVEVAAPLPTWAKTPTSAPAPQAWNPPVGENAQTEVTLSEPADGAQLTTNEVKVSGSLTATSGSKILVNGKIVEISADFKFETTVLLKPGPNVIVVQLITSDGKVKFYRRTVNVMVQEGAKHE